MIKSEIKIITLGGGTGQYHVLRALQLLRKKGREISIVAIPTTSDSGGSSGILRTTTGIKIAVGDISQCMLGLHNDPDTVSWLFSNRFKEGEMLGHSVRNIIVARALEEFGLTQHAMDELAAAFSIQGRIAPVTFTSTHLHALLGNGVTLSEENTINNTDIVSSGGIEKLWLNPPAVANSVAISAIESANYVIMCPGTPTCSLAPILLVESVSEALKSCRAKKICIANAMNRQGHVSSGSTVIDHVEFLEGFIAPNFFEYVLCNTAVLSEEQKELYAEEHKVVMPLISGLSEYSARRLFAMPLISHSGHRVDSADAVADTRSLVRHDPEKVALALEFIFYSC